MALTPGGWCFLRNTARALEGRPSEDELGCSSAAATSGGGAGSSGIAVRRPPASLASGEPGTLGSSRVPGSAGSTGAAAAAAASAAAARRPRGRGCSSSCACSTCSICCCASSACCACCSCLSSRSSSRVRGTRSETSSSSSPSCRGSRRRQTLYGRCRRVACASRGPTYPYTWTAACAHQRHLPPSLPAQAARGGAAAGGRHAAAGGELLRTGPGSYSESTSATVSRKDWHSRLNSATLRPGEERHARPQSTQRCCDRANRSLPEGRGCTMLFDHWRLDPICQAPTSCPVEFRSEVLLTCPHIDCTHPGTGFYFV